jgi:ArsR family transcriptional regulator
MKKHEELAFIMKALSDPNRLMIIDMLSCGELCACRILDKLHLTQPTLSHHMKILCYSGLVKGRKDGKWMYYTLVDEKFKEVETLIMGISSNKHDCICKEADCCD